MLNIRYRENTNTWPGFVDLFSNLVIILIFLLIMFVFLWTTTSVFNKQSGAKTVAELRAETAEQAQTIEQMRADEQEARRLLLMARNELEALDNDRVELINELNETDLSLEDLATAYEAKIADLTKQLDQANLDKEQIAKLENDAGPDSDCGNRGRLFEVGERVFRNGSFQGGRLFVHGEPLDGAQGAGTAPGRRTRPGDNRGIQRRPRKAYAGNVGIPAFQAGCGRAPGDGGEELRDVFPWAPRKDAERRRYARGCEHLAAFPRLPEEFKDKDFRDDPPYRIGLCDDSGPSAGD